MRSALDHLVTRACLNAVHSTSMIDLIEAQVLHSTDPDKDFAVCDGIKNVCAKVPGTLSNRIDQVCGLLNLSKRSFLEACMIEGIAKAQAIIDSEGLEEYYADRTALMKEGE